MKLKLSRHAQTATFSVCRRAEILKLDQYREGGDFPDVVKISSVRKYNIS